MISKYWKMLDWLATHKLGYLAAIIYAVVAVVTFPFLIVLLGLVEIIETGAISAFISTFKSFIKGETI